MLVSELFPSSVRGLAMGIAGNLVMLLTIAIALLFPLLNDLPQTWLSFTIFFGFGVVCMAVFVVFLPETKGKKTE